MNTFRKYLFFSIPIVNSFTDALIGYLFAITISPGIIRAIYIGIIILFFSPYLKFRKPLVPIYLLLIYLFVSVLLSSDIGYSIVYYFKFALPLLLLPIAYYLVDSVKSLAKIFNAMVLASLIVIIDFLIGQFINFRHSPYLDEIFLGGGEVQTTYIISYTLLLFPILFKITTSNTKKIFYYIVIIGGLLVLLFVLRRASILGLLGGYLIFITFNKSRVKTTRYVLIFVVILLTIIPLFTNALEDLFSKRLDVSEEYTRWGGRFGETYFVVTHFINEPFQNKLFGEELFNTKDLIQQVMYLNPSRPFHVDYNILLAGAGLVGLSLYLYLFINLIIYLNYLLKLSSNNQINSLLKSTFYAVITCSLIISASNQMWVVSSISAVALLLGSILGYLKNTLTKDIIKNKAKNENLNLHS